MLQIVKSESPLTEDRLRHVEEKIGHELPYSYRAFLLKHNGGRPEPARFQLVDEHGPYSDSCVAWFYAIYDGEHENLERQYDLNKEVSPLLASRLIAIGRDPGGNEIYISLFGDDCGALYFIDHETEKLSFVARSFEEFLNSLH